MLYGSVLFLSFVVSIFFTWLLFGFSSPEEASILFKILIIAFIGLNAFLLFVWLGFTGRVVITRSLSQAKEILPVAIRQGLQTAFFSSVLIGLQILGLLNGWVIIEFIILVLVFEWLWWNRERFKAIT